MEALKFIRGETPVNCGLCLYYYRLSCTLLFSSHETYTTAFGIMFVLLIFGWAIIAIWYSYHVYKEVVGGGENKEDR
ncbi:hypothetical protein DB29_02184 [Shouchella clausii]|nr:hypothetical protein DB29_02184 [Shouchella clausii]